jgi:TetR/AcrR family transcriptional repressor of multidrug resistance operon
MRPPDPKKEHSIRRKAIEMVARQGLDGFSMQRLAKAAKMSPSTLYVYFEDRDDLLFQLFKSEMALLTDQLLEGFKPEMSFAEGLRVQWKNRIRYSLTYPQQSDFLEHIRYSPYHARFMAKMPAETFSFMRQFVMAAVQRGEVARVPVELYWSFAFAPLYQLVRFHRHGFGAPSKPGSPERPRFTLDDTMIDAAVAIVVRGLRPDPSAPFPPGLPSC